jgi:hypothetical protein
MSGYPNDPSETDLANWLGMALSLIAAVMFAFTLYWLWT